MRNKKLHEMRKRQMKYSSGKIEDLDQFFFDNIRQVRWLYKNANKCKRVIGEKDALLIIMRLKDKIYKLENYPVKIQRTGKL